MCPRTWRAQRPCEVLPVSARTALAVLGIGAMIFGVASLLVSTGTNGFDTSLYRALNQVPSGVASVLTPLSKLFLPVGLALVALVGGAYCVERTRRAWPVAFCAGAAALAWLGANLAKSVAERTRPYEVVSGAILRQQPAHGTSFPSSHTAVAFAVAIAAIPYLPRRGVPVAIGYAALVGWSRVYLGVHYPLDVVAGMGVGLVAGGAALLVANRVHEAAGSKRPQSVAPPP
jgi:undecaprenyl-diphosphatase